MKNEPRLKITKFLINKKALLVLLSLIFWLAVWETVARIVNVSFAIPTIKETLSALITLIVKTKFWKSILYSILRIFLGFVIGVILGTLLAFITNASEIARAFISPFMTVTRCTPVASFIMVLWLLIGSDNVPTAIAILMVMPIIWQNLMNGFMSIDPLMEEMCQSFAFTRSKRFKHLVIPTLFDFFIPSMVVSIGLAWKAGIAAEIIAYTKNSIGKEIFDSKNMFLGAEMFAWTLTVIVLSLLFELLIKYITRRYNKSVPKA